MSEDNVEVIRRAFELWNTGDMERTRDLYDPDAVVNTQPDWPEPGPFVGRGAVFRQFEQLRSTFTEDRIEMLAEPVATGARVLVRFVWIGVGDGPTSEMEMSALYTLRDAQITRLDFFWDHQLALAAAGLAAD